MSVIPVITLETDRLRLRGLCAADSADIVRYVGDPDVARRLATVPHPYGEDDARAFIDEIAPQHSVWAVETRDERVFIGVISLKPMDSPGVAELGYWYGKPHWGRGFATEAGRAVVGHALGAGGLAALKSGYIADNPASGRVLTKLGFQETGRGVIYSLARAADVDHVDMMLWGGAASRCLKGED